MAVIMVQDMLIARTPCFSVLGAMTCGCHDWG